MRVSVKIVFAPAVKTWKILFDEQLQAGRSRCLDADPGHPRPTVSHHVRPEPLPRMAWPSKACVNRLAMTRAFQSVNQRLPTEAKTQ